MRIETERSIGRVYEMYRSNLYDLFGTALDENRTWRALRRP